MSKQFLQLILRQRKHICSYVFTRSQRAATGCLFYSIEGSSGSLDIVKSPHIVLSVFLFQGRVAGLLRPRPFLNKLSNALVSRKFCERHTNEKFIGGVIDTSEQFIGGVIDTGEQFIGGVVDNGNNIFPRCR